MSFEDSLLNFCLSCDDGLEDDNEHGPYCSQACRLADMEKSGGAGVNSMLSTPTSPMYGRASNSSSSSSLSRSLPSAPSGFQLPPAIDFSAFRRDTSANEPPSRAELTLVRTSSMSSNTGLACSQPGTAVSPPPLSPAAKQELRRYESLFDQTRRRDHRSSWT